MRIKRTLAVRRVTLRSAWQARARAPLGYLAGEIAAYVPEALFSLGTKPRSARR